MFPGLLSQAFRRRFSPVAAFLPAQYLRVLNPRLVHERARCTLRNARAANTFKMSESDPLTYGKRMEGLPSTSVIWVEPGEQPGTVIVTTDPENVEPGSLTALGLRRETMPKLRLEFHVVMQVGGAEFRYLLAKGAKYWGATKGPVSLNGKAYRNLTGAEVRQVAKRGTQGQGFPVFGQGFGNAGYGTLLQNTESKYTYELIGAEPVSTNQ